MSALLELTCFVIDESKGYNGNLDNLIEAIAAGCIKPDTAVHEPAGNWLDGDKIWFVEPRVETFEELSMSGYGIGFSPDFLAESGQLESFETEYVLLSQEDGAEEDVCTWQTARAVTFSVADIQTLYVRHLEDVSTLRTLFPQYQGTFVIFDGTEEAR